MSWVYYEGDGIMLYLAYLLISGFLSIMVIHPILIEYCNQQNIEEGSIQANTAYGFAVAYKTGQYFLMFCGIHHLALEFLL